MVVSCFPWHSSGTPPRSPKLRSPPLLSKFCAPGYLLSSVIIRAPIHPQAWLGYLATKPSFLSSKDLLKDLSKPETRGVNMRKVVRIQDPSITTSLVKQNLKSTPADKAFKWMLRLVVVRNQGRVPIHRVLRPKLNVHVSKLWKRACFKLAWMSI